MSFGAGFIKDMITMSKNNRQLLKGENPTYKNFDKTYITHSIISRKPPKYKDASPALLEKIRQKTLSENLKSSGI
ncbi:MAG: hypothetical protein OEY56_01120 [Cyclobacteriaceae bacterium]|nr:hypothetical protein [Cyclobacteriaceae bacterium]